LGSGRALLIMVSSSPTAICHLDLRGVKVVISDAHEASLASSLRQ